MTHQGYNLDYIFKLIVSKGLLSVFLLFQVPISSGVRVSSSNRTQRGVNIRSVKKTLRVFQAKQLNMYIHFRKCGSFLCVGPVIFLPKKQLILQLYNNMLGVVCERSSEFTGKKPILWSIYICCKYVLYFTVSYTYAQGPNLPAPGGEMKRGHFSKNIRLLTR